MNFWRVKTAKNLQKKRKKNQVYKKHNFPRLLLVARCGHLLCDTIGLGQSTVATRSRRGAGSPRPMGGHLNTIIYLILWALVIFFGCAERSRGSLVCRKILCWCVTLSHWENGSFLHISTAGSCVLQFVGRHRLQACVQHCCWKGGKRLRVVVDQRRCGDT